MRANVAPGFILHHPTLVKYKVSMQTSGNSLPEIGSIIKICLEPERSKSWSLMARFLDTSVRLGAFQDQERESLLSRQASSWALTAKSKNCS